MPILDRKTVKFHVFDIPGVDTIQYVDALFRDAWMPFDQTWEVFSISAYNDDFPVYANLSDETCDILWERAQQHQAKQHEND